MTTFCLLMPISHPHLSVRNFTLGLTQSCNMSCLTLPFRICVFLIQALPILFSDTYKSSNNHQLVFPGCLLPLGLSYGPFHKSTNMRWQWWGSEYTTQNRAPWYTGYFKLKEFEKQQVQEGPSGSSSLIRPSRETCPVHVRGKKHPYVWRPRVAERNLNEEGWVSFH